VTEGAARRSDPAAEVSRGHSSRASDEGPNRDGEQEGVRAALEAVRQALPFPLRGIDSDNGSEFINDHLFRYCDSRAIQFTRGRPYKKDDNAHIEQKNWTHVRRLLGYLRYDTEASREAINELYRHELCLFQNLFMPSVKLQKKERVGSRLRRHYEAPETPFRRVCASPVADPERLAELRRQRETLDPFQLSEAIQVKLEKIFRLSTEAARSHETASAASRELKRSSAKEKATGARRKNKGKNQDKKKGKTTTTGNTSRCKTITPKATF